MKKNKYDIFISYRRDGGAQYARTLQLMLEKKGYKVFLDYDELKDEQFSPQIEAAIKNSTIYLILLTKGSMARCANEGDWVRREIEIALENGKKIIPVNPDGSFDGIPEDVPQNIKDAIGSTQYSEINFGQALNATVDLMIKNRIKPSVRHHSKFPWLIVIGLLCFIVAGIGIWCWISDKDLQKLKEETTFNGNEISWAEDVTKDQVIAVRQILDNMVLIEGGEFIQGAEPLPDGSYHDNVEPEFETPASSRSVESFYMGKFEVSTGEWNAITGEKREGDPNIPMTDVTYKQVENFIKRLSDITLLNFSLPTESQWEYAAKGGNTQEKFMYAGSENPEEVAWFDKNSGGRIHANIESDLPETCTANDLFNMSGNVSEWCSDNFIPYDETQPIFDENAKVARGGNFNSEEYEITTTHRVPTLPDTSLPTLGFRLVINE